MKKFLIAAFAALSLAGCAAAGGSVATGLPKAVAIEGDHLVSADGMTLYVFDKDAAGQSACAGDCAKAWPPVAAAAEAKDVGDFTVLTRADGARQWAYQGRPLYRFAKDQKPGDALGDGVKGVWHIAIR